MTELLIALIGYASVATGAAVKLFLDHKKAKYTTIIALEDKIRELKSDLEKSNDLNQELRGKNLSLMEKFLQSTEVLSRNKGKNATND